MSDRLITGVWGRMVLNAELKFMKRSQAELLVQVGQNNMENSGRSVFRRPVCSVDKLVQMKHRRDE